MHVFISRALQKIHREAPKKHTQLRQACNEVIGASCCRALPQTAQLPSGCSPVRPSTLRPRPPVQMN